MVVLIAMFVLAVVIGVTSLIARGRQTHKNVGTVTAVTATSVVVLDSSNETTTFAITTHTKIRVGDVPGSTSDLRMGPLRVTVEAEQQPNATFVALVIQLAEEVPPEGSASAPEANL